jgi:hypothetical protein
MIPDPPPVAKGDAVIIDGGELRAGHPFAWRTGKVMIVEHRYRRCVAVLSPPINWERKHQILYVPARALLLDTHYARTTLAALGIELKERAS